MKKLPLLFSFFVIVFTNCIAQKNTLIPTACNTYLDKLIAKEPLPKYITSNWKQFDKWQRDKKIFDEIISVRDTDGAIRTTRVKRISSDTIIMLQRVEWPGDKCDYSVTPFDPDRWQEFKRGFPIDGAGDPRDESKSDNEIDVWKLIKLFE